MTATMTPCSSAVGLKKHIADLALIASRFSQTLPQEIFTNTQTRKFYEQIVAFVQSRNLEIY